MADNFPMPIKDITDSRNLINFKLDKQKNDTEAYYSQTS